ncbi:MAG: 1-acyl-sn-glycerol-3-phosphate acyltransferase [Myxococcales bacterium]|nr:1-acyl-sn-glycerol-3-phosphate acyltransferase [Myxococcales bacterium]
MASGKPHRDILELGREQLTPVERFQIRFIRKSFEPGLLDRTLRTMQRAVGANWMELGVKNLREVRGEERLPPLDGEQSVIVVANHRSFFDLFVVSAYLVKRGLRHRLIFPVRSKFFYDTTLGFFVNGAMSFFAMYPPVFRERERAVLNLATLDETIRIVRRGGTFLGLHPEGQRNKTDDPYTLLPAQSGVGRIIHESKVPVIPVFVNGLTNDLVRQVRGNFDGKGDPVTVVFGAPVDFGGLLDQPSSPRLHKKISEASLDAIRALGEEERELRASLKAAPRSRSRSRRGDGGAS